MRGKEREAHKDLEVAKVLNELERRLGVSDGEALRGLAGRVGVAADPKAAVEAAVRLGNRLEHHEVLPLMAH